MNCCAITETAAKASERKNNVLFIVVINFLANIHRIPRFSRKFVLIITVSMVELNLPEYAYTVKKREDGSWAIWDRLRERWVALTPEEWVRQHFVEWLITDKQFPAALMGNEVSLTQNGIARRCDTVVGDRTGQPLVIVEYKAPSINVTQKTFDQIVRYNMVLKAKYLIVSNGLEHYCCQIDYDNNSYRFLEDIPCYGDLVVRF